MKRRIFLSLFLSCCALFAVAEDGITLDMIARGGFGAKTIGGIRVLDGSADFARISSDGKQIQTYSFTTGKQTGVLFSIDDVQECPFKRFDDYQISPDKRWMLFQTNTQRIYRRSFTADFYVYDTQQKTIHRLSEEGGEEIPQFAPASDKVAFARANNIYIVDLRDDFALRQVTTDGAAGRIINGKPDWVYEEEFGFSSAMTFDRSGEYLCFLRFDETDVPTYDLQMYRGARPALEQNDLYPSLYSYKYPKAGCRNSTVSVHSFSLKTGETTLLPTHQPADGYVPRIKQLPFDGEIMVYTMNRHQDSLQLERIDLRQREARVVLTEHVERYVKEEVVEQTQLSERTILLPSDRSGIMQLYVYDYDGHLLRTLGDGKTEITQVYGYDEKRGTALYQAVGETPADRCIGQTDRKGRTRWLTDGKGWHTATFSSTGQTFIHQHSTATSPYVYTLCSAQGKQLAVLEDNAKVVARLDTLGLPKVEFFSFTTVDGTQLNGWMIRPLDFTEGKKYPVVMYQYSGPGSQQVVNSWNIGSLGRGAVFDYYLAQFGYTVVCVDGRGTGGRGAAFEKCTYLALGDKESTDQCAAANYLSTLPYVDGSRIGIWGWSYGGFNTLMSMSEGSFAFKAGVAIAPPTDWRFYDSIYTERYMRTPEENAKGYGCNPIGRADALQGALLLCHGTADDNVHPQNTYEYSEALVQADKDFKELFYTNRNHSIYGGNTRLHLMRQLVQWFQEHL